eukprot:CAMPEP_0178982828 /NCGR_PEP_ID=MMETSP0795-20121207/714_1 /TAXON_ID=88552 /ORGANISM="Amoebophrya sp., Strain Ameob2" /LENGTH=1810 /DNA_ID=CAMNT_0020673519 /DNA_START=87 /DNA_END=5520 /DNA_ORIENTATION=+
MSSSSMHYRALHEKQFQQLLKNEGAYKRLRLIRDVESQYMGKPRPVKRPGSLQKYHKARGHAETVRYHRTQSNNRSHSRMSGGSMSDYSYSPSAYTRANRTRNNQPSQSPFGMRQVGVHPYPDHVPDQREGGSFAGPEQGEHPADMSHTMPVLPKLVGFSKAPAGGEQQKSETSAGGFAYPSERSAYQPFQYYEGATKSTSSLGGSATMNHVTFSARRKLECAKLTRELVAEARSPPPGSPAASRAHTPRRRRSRSQEPGHTGPGSPPQTTEPIGTENKRQFRALLRRKFGSVCAGWRFGFSYSGTLHFAEFCNACRQHGIGGDIKTIWAELDVEQKGVVHLEEVHPHAAKTLKAFYEDISQQASNTLAAWRVLDPHNTQQVEKHQFLTRIKKLNYAGPDAEIVWPYLLAPFKKTLGVDEFDPVAGLAQRRGDDEMLALTETSADYRRAMTVKARQELAKEQGRHLLKTMSAYTAADFKDLLKRKYGNLWRAWRKGLGCDATKKLSFTEFCQACREVGFSGNVKGTFLEMDDDRSGVISLKELDEPTFSAIINFRKCCIEKKGSLLEAWICHFDMNQSGRVELHEWNAKCKEIGYNDLPPEQIFKLLLLEDRNFMQADDFDGKVAAAVRLDDYRALLDPTKDLALEESPENSPVNSPRRGPMEMTFNERQQETIRTQLKKAKSLAQRKFAMLRKRGSYIDSGGDLGPQDVRSFKEMLRRKFGSVARGWRAGMCNDVCNEGNKLAFVEFCNGARALGYTGNISLLFKTLDEDGSANISLGELDPDAQERIDQFNNLCKAKYGNLVNAWKKGLDEDRSGRLELEEFKRKCVELGYKGDPKQLFYTFLLEQGRQYLTMGDLDPYLMKNYLSGHHELILAPKITSAEKAKMSFVERQNSSFSNRISQFMGLEKREALVREEREKKAQMIAAKSEDGFKQQIVRRHGSMARAWRHGLDSDGNGRLSFNEFMQAARTLGYAGNMKTLWVVLGGEEAGFLGMQHLDKPLKDDLMELKKCLLTKYGTIVDAWSAMLDLQPGQTKNDEIDQGEWAEVCKIIGFAPKSQDPKQFFAKQLIADNHRKTLLLGDLKILMIELDKKTYETEWYGSHERAKNWNKLHAFGSSRSHTAAMDIQKEKDDYAKKMQAVIGKSVDGFKKMVLHRYGSLLRAWRQGLDTDGNGRLSYNEFIMSARTLGYTGNIKNLWEALGGLEKGFLGLAAFEPSLREDVHAFKNCLLEKFGCIVMAWEGMLKLIKEKQGKTKPDIDWEDFKMICTEIGFTNPKTPLKKFFAKELIADQGRQRLILEDLDILMIEIDKNAYKIQWYGSAEAAKSAALLKHGTGEIHRTKSNVLELMRRRKTMDSAMFDAAETDQIKKRVQRSMTTSVLDSRPTFKNRRSMSNPRRFDSEKTADLDRELQHDVLQDREEKAAAANAQLMIEQAREGDQGADTKRTSRIGFAERIDEDPEEEANKLGGSNSGSDDFAGFRSTDTTGSSKFAARPKKSMSFGRAKSVVYEEVTDDNVKSYDPEEGKEAENPFEHLLGNGEAVEEEKYEDEEFEKEDEMIAETSVPAIPETMKDEGEADASATTLAGDGNTMAEDENTFAVGAAGATTMEESVVAADPGIVAPQEDAEVAAAEVTAAPAVEAAAEGAEAAAEVEAAAVVAEEAPAAAEEAATEEAPAAAEEAATEEAPAAAEEVVAPAAEAEAAEAPAAEDGEAAPEEVPAAAANGTSSGAAAEEEAAAAVEAPAAANEPAAAEEAPAVADEPAAAEAPAAAEEEPAAEEAAPVEEEAGPASAPEVAEEAPVEEYEEQFEEE